MAENSSLLAFLRKLYKPVITWMTGNLATKAELTALDHRLQMQVEGLPYVDFDYNYQDGDLIMEYVEGTEIIEDNFNFANGDLTITTTS